MASVPAPLLVMYPEHDVPVLQISMPDLDPEHLFRIGQRLQPLRDEGVLIMGSGFMTHGLPFLRDWRPDADPPGWSRDASSRDYETTAPARRPGTTRSPVAFIRDNPRH